ncbi:hypothetical protein GQ44DRAFT_727970 [Phaeosphaeriaceae sp. PMI808]|nr:hypothetical protein GQ44DRAFT_727970 [Phaeosphaeriaceae sp. PMI808]
MTKIDALPDELLVSILDRVSRATLVNLNAVNKRFYRLTLDYVYKVFDTSVGDPSLFLRTVALPPITGKIDLTTRVKRVRWAERKYIASLSDSDWSGVTQTFHHLNITVPENSAVGDLGMLYTNNTALYLGHRYEFLEYFLLFLPNIQELILSISRDFTDRLSCFVNIAANPSRFTQLSKLAIRGPFNFENIEPLLTLPALRTLHLDSVRSKQVFEHNYSLKCKLDVLEIQQSCLPTETLASIITNLPPLQSFTYEHSYRSLFPYTPDSFSQPINYNLLFPALAKHASSLTSLCIHDRSDAPIASFPGYIPSLRALETLDIGHLHNSVCTFPSHMTDEHAIQDWVHALINAFLPPTLRTLRITLKTHLDFQIQDWELHMFFLSCFAGALAARGLEAVYVFTPGVWKGERRGEVERCFEGVGIEFVCVCPCGQGREQGCCCHIKEVVVHEDDQDRAEREAREEAMETGRDPCIHCGMYYCMCE